MSVRTINNQMLQEVLSGLSSNPKHLSPKYFYDKDGAALFEEICRLKEYYPTRTEISILKDHVQDIAALIGDSPILYEFGSGSSTKTRILLENISTLSGYVPIDICPDYLNTAVKELNSQFPNLDIEPKCADFCERVELNDSISVTHPKASRVAFFPGSTIGNFNPQEASKFLNNAASTLGIGGKLLIGVDLVKDISVVEKAYNDAQGVTREFNLNILRRLNSELGANFDLRLFRHLAFFNRRLSRIEMHLICIRECQIDIQGTQIQFRTGENIHTENSYKYEPKAFQHLVENAGFQMISYWTDPKNYFGVFLFEVRHTSKEENHPNSVSLNTRQALT